ncbi:MAG: metallophosphoesterase family protein [Actinomycetota bacterium]
MRFLHTADWHAGKKLGRIDRTVEFEAVFDEIVEIARDQKVDAVLVSGDLFDRALPPLDSLRLVIETLVRLGEAAGAVVAIPGNHDSAQLFEVLRPLLAQSGVILGPRLARPDSGGVISVPSRDGSERASIGLFPFLHEAQVVDFMQDSADWYKGYAGKIGEVSRALCAAFDPSCPGILMAHYFIEGSEVGGGERRIHLGQQYAATSQSVPPGAAYAALGHIHRPQEIPASAIPARYSGSLLQLDFSERTHRKEVVIIDVKPGLPAKIASIQLGSGRRLIRVEDELEALRKRADEFGDAYLDVRVKTSGPVFGLLEQVRQFLPNALMVQAVYERVDTSQPIGTGAEDSSLTDAYAGYHLVAHGVEASSDLLDAFSELEEEVLT